jgi:SAM-dependent methyltransferase
MIDNLLHFPTRGAASGLGPSHAAARAEAEAIAEQLSAGVTPPDAAFDRLLPEWTQAASSQHWTPLEVAVRAAQWFDDYRIRTVVDIGSGAGKFCVAAALAGHCHFTGLEQRERLVAGARSLVRLFGVESRVHFIHGTLGAASLPAADAYYLYNPFGEHLCDARERIDDEIELGVQRHAEDLAQLGNLLDEARPGSYVMAYNGCGMRMPANYRLLCTDRELPNVLSLWRKGVPRLISERTRARVG